MTDKIQKLADQTARAQEVIDKDPEEAQAKLAPTVNGELTLQDVFGLFLQLSKQQAELQQQLVSVLTHQQRAEQRVAHTTKEELERSRVKRERTLQAWEDEKARGEVEGVWLEPDVEEQKLAQSHNGEMPPRMFKINGIEYPIPVGQLVVVPASIAVLVHHTQHRRPLQRPPQPLAQIADPARAQFLASSQEISAGYAGKTGEGPILAGPVAASPSEAQPLDVRYDAWGR